MNKEFKRLKFKRQILNGNTSNIEQLLAEIQLLLGIDPFQTDRHLKWWKFSDHGFLNAASENETGSFPVEAYDGSNFRYYELDECTQWASIKSSELMQETKFVMGHDPVSPYVQTKSLISTVSHSEQGKELIANYFEHSKESEKKWVHELFKTSQYYNVSIKEENPHALKDFKNPMRRYLRYYGFWTLIRLFISALFNL